MRAIDHKLHFVRRFFRTSGADTLATKSICTGVGQITTNNINFFAFFCGQSETSRGGYRDSLLETAQRAVPIAANRGQ